MSLALFISGKLQKMIMLNSEVRIISRHEERRSRRGRHDDGNQRNQFVGMKNVSHVNVSEGLHGNL